MRSFSSSSGCPRQQDLQDLLFASLEIREQPQLFEHTVFEGLRLVDHHDDVAAGGQLLEQVSVERPAAEAGGARP